MADLNTLANLKRRAEAAQQTADRAQGAYDQLMAKLQQDFECASIEEAEKKLASLEQKNKKAEAAFEEAVEEFETKWATKL